MLEDKKCCGFDPAPGRATLLGVFMLAFPLFLGLSLAAPLLLPFGSGEERPAGRAAAGARAMLRLVNARMFSAFRTKGAAVLYRLSPAAAGLFYKYFNCAVLAAAWAAAAGLALEFHGL